MAAIDGTSSRLAARSTAGIPAARAKLLCSVGWCSAGGGVHRHCDCGRAARGGATLRPAVGFALFDHEQRDTHCKQRDEHADRDSHAKGEIALGFNVVKCAASHADPIYLELPALGP